MSVTSVKNVINLLTGIMLKIIADVIKPIHEKLNDHERRIATLEGSNKSTVNAVGKVEKDVEGVKDKLTISETKIRHLETNNEKLKTIVSKQQRKIFSQDKNVRLKNLVFAGLSETKPIQDAITDIEKITLILHALELNDVDVLSCRRTGNKDQGPEDRPRFLIVEFLRQGERNKVKSAANKLKDIPHLKNIRIKADLTKSERDEYKRIFDLKDTLAKENPNKIVVIEKGTVKMDGIVVDKYKAPTMDF